MPFRSWPCWLVLLCPYLVGSASADTQDDSKRACAAAFSGAQRLMRTGSLLEAKAKLVLCGGPECPEIMHADCQQWLSRVEASLPTVVFQVSSTPGPQPETVQWSLDGVDAGVLDGRAVSMDPGAHDVVFTADGFRTAKRRLVVSEGEKLRREVVLLESLPVPKPVVGAPAAPLPATSRSANPPVYRRLTVPVIVASSVAAFAGVGAVYFGIKARSDDRDLEGCAPNCKQDVVDHVKREYLWANLSIGLAVAGITTAVILYVARGKPATPAGPATRPATTLGLNAGPDAFGLSASGTF